MKLNHWDRKFLTAMLDGEARTLPHYVNSNLFVRLDVLERVGGGRKYRLTARGRNLVNAVIPAQLSLFDEAPPARSRTP